MARPNVCIDRILPRNLNQWAPRTGHNGAVRAIIMFRKMWINGSTLRVTFLGGTSAQRAMVREQARWWTEHANLSFEFGSAPDAEIRVAFDPTDGAWSYVGTDCREIPFNQPTMNLGFLDGGTAAHEFGHAIGLAHEHQNPAGGIEWDEEAVIRDLSGPPNNWDEATIRHNVLNKYSIDQIRGTDFDHESVMLYAFPATWTRNGLATRSNDALSAMDTAFIASSLAYPKTAPPPDEAVTLDVNAAQSTKASIGGPGDEDLFRFTAATGGRYLVETGGKTNVVMRLYGPDSLTNVVAEDDDSGVGVNARISANLVPGDYHVQVRHTDAAIGTGDYTVRVRHC